MRGRDYFEKLLLGKRDKINREIWNREIGIGFRVVVSDRRNNDSLGF